MSILAWKGFVHYLVIPFMYDKRGGGEKGGEAENKLISPRILISKWLTPLWSPFALWS